MIKKYFLLPILFFMIGCDDSLPDDVGSTLFDFAISRMGDVQNDETSMKTSFSDHDAIGIISGTMHSKWSHTNGTWSAADPFYWTSTDPVTFHAYYPYVETSNTEHIPMPGLSLQKGFQSDIDTLDFLCGKKEVSFSNSNGMVEFSGSDALEHQYALLVLTLRSSDKSNKVTIYSLQVEGARLFNSSYYSFQDNTVHIDDAEHKNSLTMPCTESHKVESGKYILLKLLVNPVQLDTNAKLTVNYKLNDKDYSVSTQALSKNFQSGFYYKYDISINSNGELSFSGVDINGREEETLPDLTLPNY